MTIEKKGNLLHHGGENLYKRTFCRPLLRCLGPIEVEYVMREIHDSSCGSHVGRRTLAGKVLLAEYFFPILGQDVAHLSATCLSCQRHQRLSSHPAKFLKVMIASCPFD